MATHQFYIYDGAALPYDSGNGTFTFDANYSHRDDRVLVEVTDDDAFLDADEKNNEVGEDGIQIGTVTRPDGSTVASGLIYGEEYAQIRAPDGTIIMIDRIEIGGQLIGYSPSQPLVPGVTYTSVGGSDIDNSLASQDGADTRMTYAGYQSQSVACFASGSVVQTPGGVVPVQWLRPGDMVRTRDFGPMQVRWAGVARGAARGCVTFGPGALGYRVEPRGPRVSPQHRIAIADPLCATMFGVPEVLVAAKHLVDVPGVRLGALPGMMRFHHILLDSHALINVNGLWSDSLFAPDAANLDLVCSPVSVRNRSSVRQTILPCLNTAEGRVLRTALAAQALAHVG